MLKDLEKHAAAYASAAYDLEKASRLQLIARGKLDEAVRDTDRAKEALEDVERLLHEAIRKHLKEVMP